MSIDPRHEGTRRDYWMSYSVPEPSLSGWRRFYSTDRRFPVSVAYPDAVSPFYDANRVADLHVEFGDDFAIYRLDLARLADTNTWAAEVMQGSRSISSFVKADVESRQEINGPRERFWIRDRARDMATVGSGNHSFRASRVEWASGHGERVYFDLPSRRALWSLSWMTESRYDRPAFQTFLASFRLLGDAFFDQMP